MHYVLVYYVLGMLYESADRHGTVGCVSGRAISQERSHATLLQPIGATLCSVGVGMLDASTAGVR